MILARTEATADEISSLETQLEEKIVKAKGKFNSFDQWGKLRLAFPVQKNDYGMYILARYDMPRELNTDFFGELDRLIKIKFNEVIMRFTNIRLDKDAPIDYAKPDSVEGSRVGNLDSFLKKNKMEGLLSTETPKSKGPAVAKSVDKEVAKSNVEKSEVEKVESDKVAVDVEKTEDKNEQGA